MALINIARISGELTARSVKELDAGLLRKARALSHTIRGAEQRFRCRSVIRRFNVNLMMVRALVDWRTSLGRIFKPFVFLIAAIYFLVDAVFFTIFKPVFRRLADCWVFESLRVWIASLRPYPTLALFIVPVILLEPIKPVAAYLTATGHIGHGFVVLMVGELLKLLLIERLFSVSRDKLMSIPAFAWCYDRFCQGQDWVASLPAWQLVRRWSFNAKHAVQRYALAYKAAQKRNRLSWRS